MSKTITIYSKNIQIVPISIISVNFKHEHAQEQLPIQITK